MTLVPFESALNGGMLRILSGGTYDGIGSIATVGGSSVVVDGGGVLQDPVVGAGSVVIDGTLSNSATIDGLLGGRGRVTQAVGGTGIISPGNSPGILDVSQINPSGGIDFLFEFTRANAPPTYLDRVNPGNDVLHLTHASTPFLSALTADNVILVDFRVGSLTVGDTFVGGFFTNQPGVDF